MPNQAKVEVAPNVCVDHNRKNYHIEVELPAVSKDKILLGFCDQSFCVQAERNDLVFNACYSLAHSVTAKEAKPSYDSGLLKITVPIQETLSGVKVAVK